MFAHTVSHRTKSIKSRPLSWMKAIPECYDEYPIAPISRTPSTSSSSNSTSSISPPSSRATSFMHHQNDSEATIANDILILQLSKEEKLEAFDETGSQTPRPMSRAPTYQLEHPMLSLPPPPESSLVLPPPSSYLDIADQNPWEATDGAESIYSSYSPSSSSPDSPVSPLSLLTVPAIPERNSSRLMAASRISLTRSRSIISQRSTRSIASVATTIGGSRNKYSTKLLFQKSRAAME